MRPRPEGPVGRLIAVLTPAANASFAVPVGPPAAPAVDVAARVMAEVGRADDEELESLRPGLVASPRARRDSDRVPFPELDDLVVDLHPPAAAHDHVHLFLRHV